MQKEVNIAYNKLHADPQQGKSLDIILKKVKHRLVEHMSTETADALGLSRAILCNDSLVQKLKDLENIEITYRGLVDHATRVMKAFYAILKVYKGNFFDNVAGYTVCGIKFCFSIQFLQLLEIVSLQLVFEILILRLVKFLLSLEIITEKWKNWASRQSKL